MSNDKFESLQASANTLAESIRDQLESVRMKHGEATANFTEYLLAHATTMQMVEADVHVFGGDADPLILKMAAEVRRHSWTLLAIEAAKIAGVSQEQMEVATEWASRFMGQLERARDLAIAKKG